MLGGADLAAIRNGNGDWEITQFLTATLVDVQTYEIAAFTRQFGTEAAIADRSLRALSVLLDGAVARVDAGKQLELPFNWRYGPGNRGIGDASYARWRSRIRVSDCGHLSTSKACALPAISASRGYGARAPAATTGSGRRSARRRKRDV